MGKIKLAFRLEKDDRFVVMARAWSQDPGTSAALATETTYDHEDLFLKLVIFADLDDELTRQLVVAVILSVAQPHRPSAWISAEISEDQNEVMGLNLPPESLGPLALQTARNFTVGAQAGAPSPSTLQTDADHFHDLLTNARTPFATFEGPEHIVTVVNPPYVRVLGRSARG